VLARNGVASIEKRSLGNTRRLNRLGEQLSTKVSLGARYNSILSLTQPEDLKSLLNPSFYSSSACTNFESEFSAGEISAFDRMIRSDITHYLPGDLLVKVDMATMANNLELRSPLLDVELVEWGLSLPQRFKVKGFETKHILKDVARSLVPNELIDRPKMGFAIPRAEWLRNGMRDMVFDTLTDPTAKKRGWFIQSEVKLLLNGHMDGKDRGSILWPMLMLELWARNWLD